MRTDFLIVAAIAAAFAASCTHTGRDRTSGRTSDMATPTARSDGGAEAMLRALDKNNDGFISRAEAQGTPHDRDFEALDTNRDGLLSRAEHAAAPEHQRSAAAPMNSQSAAAPGTGGAGGPGGTTSSKY